MNYGEEIVFTGGINSDDEARVVPKGDYRDFHYCRLGEVSGKGFCVVTSQGTEEVFNDDLDSTDKILGGAAWEKQNAIVYFVYKSGGPDEIWKYDIATKTHDLVITSTILNFSPDWPIFHANIIDDILKWTDGRWQDTHYMYDPATGDRVFNPPFQINIQKALDLFYSGINNELRTFDAVKWPMNPPSCVYGTDASRVDNKLRRKLFKFMVQPIYENGETGVWSMYSNLPIPTVNELVTGTNWLDPKTDNVIYVRFNTGPKNITKINVAVQQFDETSYGAEPNFGTFLQLNKANDGISDDVDYTVSFYGDAALSQIADLFKNYDRLPIEANCQEFLPTNELTYVNFREGFEKITIDAEADYTITYIDYSPTSSDIFIAVNPNTNNVESPAKFDKVYATTETFRTELNSFSFSIGDTYTSTIYLCQLLGTTYDPPLEFNVQYTITQADYDAAIAVGTQWDAEKYFLEKVISTWCDQMTSQAPLPDLGLYVDYTEVMETPPGPTSLLIGGKYYELEVKKISDNSNGGSFSDKSLCGLGNAYYNANPDPLLDPIPVPYNNPPIISLRPNGVVTSLKKGARHQFGIVYGDRAYRDGTVYTSSDMEVFVKWPSEEDRIIDSTTTPVTTNERPYYVNPVIRINHQPPVWATKYWIVARQNTQIGDFGQFALTYDENGSPAVTTESDGKFRVYLDNYYENNNLGATINYQIKRGDVVRFLWKTPKGIYYGMDMTDNISGDILYYTDYIELEVLDYDPGEAGGRQSIYVSRMNKSLISSTNKFYSILIEIYRPQPAVMDNDVFVSPWRDITPSFNVLNPHLENRIHDVESIPVRFSSKFTSASATQNYIDVPGNASIAIGTTIKINNWTGATVNNDVFAVVTSTSYPENLSGITTTRLYLENIFYENTGDTLNYLVAPYNWSSTNIAGSRGLIPVYGVPQEYQGNPAEINPQYGDVFMRQRIYGTGVSISSLQLEEGAEPLLNVEVFPDYNTSWPNSLSDTRTNILFNNQIESYPAGSWVHQAATTTSQAKDYYEVPYPGDYTFDYSIELKQVGGSALPDGELRMGVEGNLLSWQVLATITNLPTSPQTFSGTTTPVSLNPLDKVWIYLERTDFSGSYIINALSGFGVGTGVNQIIIVGNFSPYFTSSDSGIASLNPANGSIVSSFNSISDVTSIVNSIKTIENGAGNYFYIVGGNFYSTMPAARRFVNLINESDGSNASPFTSPFSIAGDLPNQNVKTIETGNVVSNVTQGIYIGGSFSTNLTNYLIKINLDGSFEPFPNGDTFPGNYTSSVETIRRHQQSSEPIQKRVLVGGTFTSYKNLPINNFVVISDNNTNPADDGKIYTPEYASARNGLDFNNSVYKIQQTYIQPIGIKGEDTFYVGGDFTSYTTRSVRAFRAAYSDGSGNYLNFSLPPGTTAYNVLPVNNKTNANLKLYDTTSGVNITSYYWGNNVSLINGAIGMKVQFKKTQPSGANGVSFRLLQSITPSFSSSNTQVAVYPATGSYITNNVTETWSIPNVNFTNGQYFRIEVRRTANSTATLNITDILWEIDAVSSQILSNSPLIKSETFNQNRLLKIKYTDNSYFGNVFDAIPFTNFGSGPNGRVRAILGIGSPATSLLVGGDFTSWNGDDTQKYLIRIDADTGAIVPSWTPLDLNDSVTSIEFVKGGYFVGGNFSFAGNTFYAGVLKLDPTNNYSIDPSFVSAGTGPSVINIAKQGYFKLNNVDYNAADVGPAPTTMYWYIEDRHYSDFWKSDVHNVGRFRLEDPNAKTVHRKASAIHSDSLIFGTQVNGLSSFGLDNQNIVDLNPVHGEIVRCITSGRDGKTLKCLQPNKENSIYIQFYPNEVGDTSNLRVSDKTFSTWFDYKSLFGTTEAGGVALLPDGTTIYFDPTRGAFVYSDMNGQRVISETSIDSQVDYKFRTKTKELAKRFREENGEVRTYVNEKMGEVGFAFRFTDGEVVEYVHVVWDYIRERWRSTYDYNAAGYLNFGQTLIGWNSDNEIYLHNDPDSINFHGKTDWMQKITFVANEQPNVVKRFQNIVLRSDKAFDVTAESTSNYNYGVMETEMPSSMFVFYEGYGKSYYRKNKNTLGQASPTLAMINGEDMRGDAMTHTLSFEPDTNDKSRTLFSVGISGVLS
jgi:hypothetical protein